MKNKLILLIFLSVFSTIAAATEGLAEPLRDSVVIRKPVTGADRSDALGVAFSTISGPGLCWTHRWTERGTSKLTGVLTSVKSGGDTRIGYVIGGEYQVDIISRSGRSWHNSRYRFFSFAGAAWWDRRTDRERGDDSEENYQLFTAGLGVGFALHIDHRLVIEFTTGMQIAEQFKSVNDYSGAGAGVAMLVLF
jgi:hypothetical protein